MQFFNIFHFIIRYYQLIMLGFCILNLIAYELYDHSFRIYNIDESKNKISRDYLELITYIFFAFDVVLNCIAQGVILEQGTYLRKIWNIFFFCLLIFR